MTAPLPAGSHGQSLDVVHADMGPELLQRHLADVHGQPIDRRLGAAVAQQAHRVLHGEEPS